jgi:hypothetical protein
LGKHPSGVKARVFIDALMARLKSCPDTKLIQLQLFTHPVSRTLIQNQQHSTASEARILQIGIELEIGLTH